MCSDDQKTWNIQLLHWWLTSSGYLTLLNTNGESVQLLGLGRSTSTFTPSGARWRVRFLLWSPPASTCVLCAASSLVVSHPGVQTSIGQRYQEQWKLRKESSAHISTELAAVQVIYATHRLRKTGCIRKDSSHPIDNILSPPLWLRGGSEPSAHAQ